MSRLRIFALLATVVALAGALTACGGSDSSSDDPQEVIQNATLEGVESGTIELALRIVSTGGAGGEVDFSLAGPFQSAGDGTLPKFDLVAAAKGVVAGGQVDFDGGLTLLADRAFVNYKGTEYEVDPTTFGLLKSSFEGGQGQGGSEAADPAACQEAFSAIDLGTVIENPIDGGGADVEGTETTKVSGKLDPKGAIDAVIALTDDPACAAQLDAAGAAPLEELESMGGDVSDALKKAHVDVYVGDDDIIRKVDAAITVEPKDQSGEKVEFDFSLTLGAVNEEQTISAPPTAEPLEGLFKELGINPLELLEASEGGGLGGLLEALGGDSGEGLLGNIDLGEVDLGDLPGTEFSQEYLECLEEAQTASDLQDCASLLG